MFKNHVGAGFHSILCQADLLETQLRAQLQRQSGIVDRLVLNLRAAYWHPAIVTLSSWYGGVAIDLNLDL
jgi:hypothetical protein